jgi:long-chain fatty acid transport protein
LLFFAKFACEPSILSDATLQNGQVDGDFREKPRCRCGICTLLRRIQALLSVAGGIGTRGQICVGACLRRRRTKKIKRVELMTAILRSALRLTASAAVLAIAASAAQASSFAIRAGQSAEGLGMAYAGAASGGIGMGAMAWNPAAITMFPGRQSQWNATYLNAIARYTGVTGPTAALGNSDPLGINGAFIPASYNAWQLTDRLFVGLTNTAPFGLRSKPGGSDGTWAGQTYGRSATIRTVNIAPTVGFKINDWISVGAALQIQYGQVDLKQALATAPGAAGVQIRGDSYDFGYRVGVTLTPWQGSNIGIAYRSGIDQKVKGRFTRYDLPLTIPVSAKLPLPGSVVFGLSQQINAQWSAHLGVEWTNWGRFGTIAVNSRTTGANITNLRFEYKDSWFFSGGAEYRWNDALTLRAGVGYELSAVDDTSRSVFVSDNDRLWLSAGMSYKFSERLNLDVGYTFITVNKARIAYGPGTAQGGPLPLTAVANPTIHIVSAGLTYRWDTPSVAESVAPAAVRVRN